MVRKVIWSERALSDRREILTYWKNRNKSNRYSKKLNGLFRSAIQLIREHPQIGRPTSDKESRIKIVKDYLLIYDITETAIHILLIWDTRQDPDKLKEALK
jgi:addiction module RelE/StbE family toxin